MHLPEGTAHRPHHQVALVAGYVVRARALDAHLEAHPVDRGGELVTQCEGESQRVEARAEVRRGGRHRDGDRSFDEPRHQTRPATAAASSTFASMTLSTTSPKPSSAVTVSLSP